MRQITIDFTSQTYPMFAGYIGEHNATEVTAIKPDNFDGENFSFAFMTNGEVIHSKFFSADEELKVTLWEQLTQNNELGVQLEAFGENGNYLAKSPLAKLVFSTSAHGIDFVADTDNADVYSDISQNTSFREMLKDNVDTLDKLTTSKDGTLLFNGEEINGGNIEGDFVTRPELDSYRRKDALVNSNEVYYKNSMLQDKSYTIKGAMDEALDYVLTSIPKLHEAVSGKQEKGDYVTATELDTRLENVSGFSAEIVDALPTENIKTNTMYFVSELGTNALPSATDDKSNVYNGIGYKKNTKWHDILGDVAADGVDITGYIPVKPGDVIHLENVTINKADTNYPCVLLFAGDYYFVYRACYANELSVLSPVWDEDNLVGFTIPHLEEPITHFRIQASSIDETSAVSVNDAYTEYIYVNGAWEKVGGALTEEQVTAIADNTKARHTHSNKTVLDALNVDGEGNLLFNNSPVAPESKDPQANWKCEPVEVDDQYMKCVIHGNTTNCISIETNSIPENAKVKKVEIQDIVNGTNDFVSLEDLIRIDPVFGAESPYFVMYPNARGMFFRSVALVVFPIVANSFYDSAASSAFIGTTAKIYYEIEE